MSTTTVTETMVQADDTPAVGVKILVKVMASVVDPDAPAYGNGVTYITAGSTVTNGSGVWSMDLTPNSERTPSGTVYLVYYETRLGERTKVAIIVPVSATPVNVSDPPPGILTTLPSDLPDPGAINAEMDGDVGGTVGANTINALAVTAAKLAAGAVTTAKIATGAVTTTELGASAVTTAKIASAAVTSTELAASSVTTGKIASDAVTATEIATGAVGTSELAAAAATTAKIADAAATPAKLAGEVAGIFDPVTSLSGWTQASTASPLAFDTVGLVTINNRPVLTIPSPNQGPNNSATNAAAHGAVYKDWGAAYADNIRVRCYWYAKRPGEATPLIHVVPGTTSWGIGMWPGFDVFPGVPGGQSVWLLGYIGNNNTNFPGPGGSNPGAVIALTAAELLKYSDVDNPSAPVPIDLVSVNNVVTVWVDGILIPGCTMTVPAELRGSSVHGIAVDNNPTDGQNGAGGAAYGGTDRPANFPAASGPFSITKVLASGMSLPVDPTTIPDARDKGATFYGPFRAIARADVYRPGGVTPIPVIYGQLLTSAGAEIAHAQFIEDGTGKGQFSITQANGALINFGSAAGRPAAGFFDGTTVTTLTQLSGGGFSVTTTVETPAVTALGGANGTNAHIRLTGAMTTGMPTSGVLGDVILVRDTRLLYLCTATGTPGTWVALGALTYQPLDTELTALAGLTSAADRLPYFNGAGTATLATFTAAGRALIDDADATAQRATLGLVIGTNVQAYDAELAALAGTTSAADTLPYFNGSGTATTTPLTAAGRALIDDTDNTAQRATLGLGTVAVRSTLGGQAPSIDYGAVRAGSTAEGSILSAVLPIGANIPAANDQYVLKFEITIANLTGGTITSRIRSYIGATVVGDRTYSLTTFTGLVVFGEMFITFEGISPSPIVRARSTLISGSGSAAGDVYPQNPNAGTPLSTATTSAINLDVTAQHNATTAGFQTELYVASLTPVSRY